MKPIPHALKCLIVLCAFAVCALAPAQDTTDSDAAKAQVLVLFKVFKTRDWRKLYDITAFSDATAKTMGDRDTFASDFEKGIKESDPQDGFGKVMDELSDISVGAVIIEDGFAYVPTSCVLDVDSTKVRLVGVAKMKKVGDTWKWDLTFTDDSEKAATVRTTQLLGDPAKGS